MIDYAEFSWLLRSSATASGGGGGAQPPGARAELSRFV